MFRKKIKLFETKNCLEIYFKNFYIFYIFHITIKYQIIIIKKKNYYCLDKYLKFKRFFQNL